VNEGPPAATLASGPQFAFHKMLLQRSDRKDQLLASTACSISFTKRVE
jgi:hypothetical protein